MSYIVGNGRVHLQSTLAACCHDPGWTTAHHPILCAEELELDEREFRCPHLAVPITDWRTQQAIQHSVAILLIELASRL